MMNPFETHAMPTPFFNQDQDIAGRLSHVPDAALQTTPACTGSLELQAERLHTEPIRQNRMLMQVNEAEQTSGGSNSWEPASIQSFPIRFIRKGLWTLFQRKHILVFMIACLGLFGVLNPSSSIATGATAQAKTRMITVNRSQLALTCMGEGSPTVLLESDLATASDEWIPVQEQLAATTQVCRYDRAGLGQSDLPYRPKLGCRMPRTSS